MKRKPRFKISFGEFLTILFEDVSLFQIMSVLIVLVGFVAGLSGIIAVRPCVADQPMAGNVMLI